jgi:hypothetical protein
MTSKQYDATRERIHCPFCGRNKPYIAYTEDGRLGGSANTVVVCSYCGATGPPRTTVAGAFKAMAARREPRVKTP